MTLAGVSGTIRLPADYTAELLDLGYAQTGHATQGRTVDVALLLVGGPTDSRGIYTPMTRGREANHAYVVVADNQTARDLLTQAITRDWIDQPAIALRAQLDLHRSRRAAPADGDQAAELERRVRRLIEQRRLRTRAAERTAGRVFQVAFDRLPPPELASGIRGPRSSRLPPIATHTSCIQRVRYTFTVKSAG